MYFSKGTRHLAGLMLFVLLAYAPRAQAQDIDISLGDDPRISDAELRLGVFAGGLDFPMGMIDLPDGSILVATSTPDGGAFFQSTGQLLRLRDRDGDGAADGRPTVLATDLDGPLVAVARAGNLVFTTSARFGEERISVFRRGEDWASPLEPVGEIAFDFNGSEHQSYGLAVRETPGDDGSYDLLFNAGAFGNLQLQGPWVGVSGLTTGTIEDGSIYLVRVRDVGDAVEVSEPVQVARGLRNASAFVFDRETGDLVIGENGIDTPDNRIVSLSADELNVIPVKDVGVTVYDFGFPDAYIDYATGDPVGEVGTGPVVAYTPLDGSESEGIASLASMPALFPEELREGYVAGFHGQYDETGDGNEENPLVWADLETGDRFELVANDNPGVGHLDSLLATDDALLIADVCATGSLAAAEPCGVIYRLTAGASE